MVKKKYSTIFYNKITKCFHYYVYKTDNGWKTLSAGIQPFEECVLLTIEQYKRLEELTHDSIFFNWNYPNQKEIEYILNNIRIIN